MSDYRVTRLQELTAKASAAGFAAIAGRLNACKCGEPCPPRVEATAMVDPFTLLATVYTIKVKHDDGSVCTWTLKEPETA